MHNRWVTIAAAALLLPAVRAAAADMPCDSVMMERLVQLGVTTADIGRIDVLAQRRSRQDESYLVGWLAWVQLKSCEKGTLIIDLSTSCRVQQVYTRDGCQLDGVRNWC